MSICVSVACDGGWHLYVASNLCFYSSPHKMESNTSLQVSIPGAAAYCDAHQAKLVHVNSLVWNAQTFVNGFTYVIIVT